MKRTLTLIGTFGVATMAMLATATPALAWEPFRARNQNIESGNAAMAEEDAAGALRSYDAAARELPNDGGVHLDRGLALMGSGQTGPAREAFLAAASPEGSDEVRASAFYNMGLSFYVEGDAAAGEDDHETAQARFREAADAFRRSLRTVPGNRDAAWNLELALRRMNDEREEQEREEQEQQEQEEQDQQDQEEQDPDGEPQDGEPQDGDEEQDGEPQDGDEEQDGEPQDGDQSGDEENEEEGGDSQGDEQSEESQDDSQQPDEPQDGDGTDQQTEEAPEEGPEGQNLPRHLERVLDNLQDDEESLERHRARARAARERRRPLRDW